LLAEIEAGSALFAGTPTCGCGPITPWGARMAQRLFLPEQSAYPARFFAEVRTTISNVAVVATLVFVRDTRSGTWKVVIDSQQQVKADLNPEPELDHLLTDGSGYDASIPQVFSPSPAPLTAALASYWQYWKNSRRAPTGTVFQPGVWTTQWGAHLRKAIVFLIEQSLSRLRTGRLVAISKRSSCRLGNPVGERPNHSGCAVGDIQSGVDVLKVSAHRSLGQPQLASNLEITTPAGD
jgi:hypothetical protein